MHLHFYSLLKFANPCVHTANVVQSPGFTVHQVAMKRSTNQTHWMSCSLLTNHEKQKCSFPPLMVAYPFLASSRSFSWWCRALSIFPRSISALPTLNIRETFNSVHISHSCAIDIISIWLPMQLWRFPSNSLLLGSTCPDHSFTTFMSSRAFFRPHSVLPELKAVKWRDNTQIQ